MNKRLQLFLNAEGISQSQLADTLNVARASVSHILSGRNKPGYDFITNMIRYYPMLDLEWLLTGKGRMYKDSSKSSAAAPLPEEPQPPITQGESAISLQEYDPEENNLFSVRETPPPVAPQVINTQKKISKILVFYDDNSYLEL